MLRTSVKEGKKEQKIKERHSGSRQNFKLEAINQQSAVRDVSGKAMSGTKKTVAHLKADISQGTIPRAQKIYSLKIENDKIIEVPAQSNQLQSRTILKKIENGERGKDYDPIDNRSTACKSFMIRKKNISSYAKKLDSQLTKFQLEFTQGGQLAAHQLFFDEQHLNPGRLSQKQSNSDKEIKDKKHESHESILNQTAIYKVKPVICKNQKSAQQKSVTKTQQNPHDKVQKHIQKMIKKVRNSSQSDHSNMANQVNKIVNSGEPTKVTPDHSLLSNMQIKNSLKESKMKTFNGCKTIRIFWGEGKERSNEELGSNKKMAPIKIDEEKACNLEHEDLFGGEISVINKEQLHYRDAQIESLKELFHHLNHHSETVGIISKQFIE